MGWEGSVLVSWIPCDPRKPQHSSKSSTCHLLSLLCPVKTQFSSLLPNSPQGRNSERESSPAQTPKRPALSSGAQAAVPGQTNTRLLNYSLTVEWFCSVKDRAKQTFHYDFTFPWAVCHSVLNSRKFYHRCTPKQLSPDGPSVSTGRPLPCRSLIEWLQIHSSSLILENKCILCQDAFINTEIVMVLEAAFFSPS